MWLLQGAQTSQSSFFRVIYENFIPADYSR